jgi:hypothetical protein
MPLQILTLKLDGITAGDYLAWCRDPDPPALGFALRSLRVKADPLGDTITAILDWNRPVPAPRAAAAMAGLSLPPGSHVHTSPTDVPRTHKPSRVDHRHGPKRVRSYGPAGARVQPPSPAPEGLKDTHVRHELALAFTDLGGATFALAHQGALNDERLAPRVQRIHDLFAQLNPLDRPTRTSQQSHEPVTTMAA